jgi:hypothetical protein
MSYYVANSVEEPINRQTHYPSWRKYQGEGHLHQALCFLGASL